MELTRRYRFCASHRLHSPELSAQANQQIYGKCNNPYGHGHNYEIEVTVSGPIDSRTGRVVNLQTLDALVRERVIGPLDHRNLNEEVASFQDLVPTTENLCVVIEQQLREAWPRPFPDLKRVSIWETARNIFVI
jgi:6-pyruvoyltetrahydropterin/6-carboxytetrahydropterin synthase